jgi:hypothetical protein
VRRQPIGDYRAASAAKCFVTYTAIDSLHAVLARAGSFCPALPCQPDEAYLLTLFGRLLPPMPSGTEKIFSISC